MRKGKAARIGRELGVSRGDLSFNQKLPAKRHLVCGQPYVHGLPCHHVLHLRRLHSFHAYQGPMLSCARRPPAQHQHQKGTPCGLELPAVHNHRLGPTVHCSLHYRCELHGWETYRAHTVEPETVHVGRAVQQMNTMALPQACVEGEHCLLNLETHSKTSRSMPHPLVPGSPSDLQRV